ncbi:TPA: AlpA family phage regulatory protein [Stenotrophomonas maltophilia]|nr:AlpA family phage regulatory protein [Stenotrophomonas maltophilia]MBH1711313.1 AlpA family phage regulatory protein [Stenotrophomonas maltophilia]HEL3759485.1 AlpA family phage regulatory protein [Stenotrophomonas maltophilia]
MPSNHILSSTVAMLPLAPQSEGEDSSPAHLVSLELHRAVRAPEAMRLCGLKRSHFWALQQASPLNKAFDPTFPRRFKLGEGARAPTVWWLHELIAWLEARASASRNLQREVHQ